MSVHAITATVDCDNCGKRFTVELDPADRLPEGSSLWDAAEHAGGEQGVSDEPLIHLDVRGLRRPAPRYEIRGGEYVFLEEGDALFSSPEIALAFDRDDWALLKHGPPGRVERWLLEARRAYRSVGYPEMAEGLGMVSSDRWDVEELNRCIDNSGYIQRVVEGDVGRVSETVGPPGAQPVQLIYFIFFCSV